ncbi:hypothetical protein S245_051040, partial [Arachis hypogaea]
IWLFVEFDSVEEAHARYVEHARVTGFVVRKGDSRKDNEGNVVRKFFFCNREGLRDKKHYERIDRQRAHKPITRTNCNARFVVHLDKGCGKWKMKSFVADYNHELAPADRTNIMAPHRHMSEGDKAHVHSLHEAGFQRTQIMGFFAYLTAAQDGDTYENVLSELEKLTKEIEATGPRGGRNRFGRAGDVHVDILDPTIVKSKGAPRGSTNARMGRQCRRCHGLEHDRRNCTTRNEGLDDEGAGTINRQSQTFCKRVRRNYAFGDEMACG